MLQRSQLEHISGSFQSEVAELRHFLAATSIPVGTEAALPSVVSRLVDDRAFRRDLQLHLWSVLHDSALPVHTADLLGILTVATAGTELAASAQNDDAHDLLRFVMEVRASLGSTISGQSSSSDRHRGLPARWIPATRRDVRTTVLRFATVLMILCLGLLLLRKRAPYTWQAPIAADLPSRGPETNLPGPRVMHPQIATYAANEGKRIPSDIPLAVSVMHVPKAPPVAANVKPNGTRAVQSLSPTSPLQRDAPDVSPVRDAAPRAPDMAAGYRTATAARPAPATVAGAIPTAVLSQRIGARSLPFPSSAEESLYYPAVPKLLRRTASAKDPGFIAANNVQTAAEIVRESPGSPTLGSVHPVSLGTMAANLLYSPAPPYPAAAAAAHVQGEVTVQAEVDRDGNVASARVISGPPQLREAAVEAVHRWRYRPFVSGGRAVAMTATAVMDFELR